VTRSHKSAKNAGTKLERDQADYLAKHIDDRIDRRTRNGAKDRGDIGGLRHMGQRIVIECKDTTRWEPGAWLREADIERGNDDAIAGLVIAKRRGHGQPGDQLVMMTVRDLVAILTGSRPDEDGAEDGAA
jgi:hypothetical protein